MAPEIRPKSIGTFEKQAPESKEIYVSPDPLEQDHIIKLIILRYRIFSLRHTILRSVSGLSSWTGTTP